jgi:carboxymethylenebutenolidase
MVQPITFLTPAGEAVAGALALPAGGSPRGGLIVVHEWWGINDDIRGICDRFAAEGFAAMAVDLYGGRSTTDPSEAMELVNDLKTANAIEIMRAAVEPLRAQGCGKVGVTGFCLGGAMALAAACNVEGIAAAVPFYGIAKEEFLRFGPGTAPIQGHFGKQDGSIPAERAAAVRDKALAAGAAFELHLYDAGHAFMRASDPRAYDAPSAALAWERAVAFLRDRLA